LFFEGFRFRRSGKGRKKEGGGRGKWKMREERDFIAAGEII